MTTNKKINLRTLVNEGTQVVADGALSLVTGAATLGIIGAAMYMIGDEATRPGGSLIGTMDAIGFSILFAGVPAGMTYAISNLSGTSAIKNLKKFKKSYNQFRSEDSYTGEGTI